MTERSEAAVCDDGFGLLGGLGVREDDGGSSSVESPGSPVGSMGRKTNDGEGGALGVVVEGLDHILEDVRRKGGVLGVEKDEVAVRWKKGEDQRDVEEEGEGDERKD